MAYVNVRYRYITRPLVSLYVKAHPLQYIHLQHPLHDTCVQLHWYSIRMKPNEDNKTWISIILVRNIFFYILNKCTIDVFSYTDTRFEWSLMEIKKTWISNILVRNNFLYFKQIYCCLTFVCMYSFTVWQGLYDNTSPVYGDLIIDICLPMDATMYKLSIV